MKDADYIDRVICRAAEINHVTADKLFGIPVADIGCVNAGQRSVCKPLAAFVNLANIKFGLPGAPAFQRVVPYRAQICDGRRGKVDAAHRLGCPLAFLVGDKRVDIQWAGRTALLAFDQGAAQSGDFHFLFFEQPQSRAHHFTGGIEPSRGDLFLDKIGEMVAECD